MFNAKQGGLSLFPSVREIRTVVHHQGETHSCIVWFDEKLPYALGTSVVARMEILMPQFRKKFSVGDIFALWQGKVFAVGIVQQSP